MSSRKLLLIGGLSGGGRELLETAELCNLEPVCILFDNQPDVSGLTSIKLSHLPLMLLKEPAILARPGPFRDVEGLRREQKKRIRWEASVEEAERHGILNWTCLVHPSSQVSPSAILGKGVFVGPLVSIASETQIGNFTRIGRNSNVGHDVVVGSYVAVGPGVTIPGGVIIGSGVTVGSGSVFLNSVTVGSNALIGSGSTVVEDVRSGTRVMGQKAARRFTPRSVLRRRTLALVKKIIRTLLALNNSNKT